MASFVNAAEHLGSNWWQPIEAMAAAVIAVGHHVEAVAVFTAADQPGMHRDHLRRRRQAVLRAIP